MTDATVELTRPEFGDPAAVFDFEHGIAARAVWLTARLDRGDPPLGVEVVRQFRRDTDDMIRPAIRVFAARVQSCARDKRCTEVTYRRIRSETGWDRTDFIRQAKLSGEMGKDKLLPLIEVVDPIVKFPSLKERQVWPQIRAIERLQRLEGIEASGELNRERYELAVDLLDYSDWVRLRSAHQLDQRLLQQRLDESLKIVQEQMQTRAYLIEMDNPDAVYKPQKYTIPQVDRLLWEFGPAIRAWSDELPKRSKPR